MLVLTRKQDETIVLPDLNLTIRVAAIQGGRVRLALEAPKEIRILRQEVALRGLVETPSDCEDCALLV
jgi:carbon storage regulator